MVFTALYEVLPEYALGKNHNPSAIKRAILATSNLFTFETKWRPLRYFAQREALQGYLLYFVPVNLNKIYRVLGEVLRHPSLRIEEGEIRILDIGCGVTPSVLAFLELKRHGFFPEVHFDYTGVDMDSRAIAVAQELLQTFVDPAEKIHYRFLKMDFRKEGNVMAMSGFRPHFLTISNALQEIIEQGVSLNCFIKSVAMSFKENVVAIFIEPGTKKASQTLHALRDSLLQETGIAPYSPCLHRFPCPALKEANWCYEEWSWECPEYLSFLEPIGLQTRYLKFSYTVFTSWGYSLAETFSPHDEGPIIKSTSHLLREKRKSRLFGCSEGNLQDIEKLERDYTPDDPWLTIKKGTYFTADPLIPLGKKLRLLRESKLCVLYQPSFSLP